MRFHHQLHSVPCKPHPRRRQEGRREDRRERQRAGGKKVCDIGLCKSEHGVFLLVSPFLTPLKGLLSVQEGEAQREEDKVCNWRNICGLRGGINVCSPRRFSPGVLFSPFYPLFELARLSLRSFSFPVPRGSGSALFLFISSSSDHFALFSFPLAVVELSRK